MKQHSMNLRDAFLKKLRSVDNLSPAQADISLVYYHIFSVQDAEVLERDLKFLFNLRRGEDSFFKESGNYQWFAIWHKTIRQGDYFNDCFKRIKLNLMTDEQRSERKFLYVGILDGTVVKESLDANELFTKEYKRYIELGNIERSERAVEKSISGHLDMILWNTVNVDKEGFLINMMGSFFDENEKEILTQKNEKQSV